MKKLTRRKILGSGAALAGTVGAQKLVKGSRVFDSPDNFGANHPHLSSVTGEVNLDEFNPSTFLYEFDYGKVSKLPDGTTFREWEIISVDKEIEIAPGVFFPAWTYNGQVPGPTLRCTEGDQLRIRFKNGGSHPHTIHFHGVHEANMDGVFEIVHPGEEFVYEFSADPMGLHLYHCHTVPLKRHIHKGLYGAFIIDPKESRPQAREMIMVMNGFDTNFDNENEIYAVNTVAFHHQKHPIDVIQNELVRIYLINLLEFDLVNSLHIHGNFFNLFRTGTKLTPDEFTDTVMMCQGERHILELRFPYTGNFMFHAHQSEFAELGWMGLFNVKEHS
jgi:FtsP/CotA-like multicopper oxidase with cupredoxin domain